MDEGFKEYFMKDIVNKLRENKFQNIYVNENLSKYSWFNLGGPSEIFFRPESEDELSSFLKFVKNSDKKIGILGAGSNTLIRDGGVKGITIKLSSNFSYLNLEEKNIIKAGAATLDKNLSNYACDKSIEGFEFLSCIPGSVGGAIKMNSGCYNYDISKILHSLEVLDLEGNKKEILADKINFFYRGCDLHNDYIILSAKFKGKIGNKEKIKKKKIKFINKKKISQPSRVKTCGSTFKNTDKKKAWELIKQSNCENLKVGNTRISEKHCNFFINEGSGTCQEIEELISKVKTQVFKKTGIKLELEIKIIGTS